MGTLSVQPPSGSMRSLTEVFVLLRNNAVHNKYLFSQVAAPTNVTSDERMSLVTLDEDLSASSRIPPEWVNIVDEVHYEMTRVRSRMKQLREMQQRHLTRPSFSDDGGDEQEAKLEQTTSDVTGMLAHCHRLIGTVEHADNCHRAQQLLQQNVTASLLVALQTLTIEFRTQQNRYLQSIETRAGNVDHYFADTSDWKEQTTSAELFATAPEQGLSMVQMQQLMENADVVREREREIISVGRSILELNTLFKDVAALIVDQGTILDRIDYNVEQASVRVKSGLHHVHQAETYQRKNRKMQCILVLAVSIVVLILLLILVKS